LIENGGGIISMHNRKIVNVGVAVVSTVLALYAPGACAQSAAQASQDESPPALNEIVVTATKRAESIQSVPASVSVLSGPTLEAAHVTDLEDYAAYMPGLQVDSGGTPGQTTITLRGIAPIGSGNAVGTYIDDVPLGSSGLYALANSFQLDLLPYDLDHVEVLRGPQGTLYGASTMGGLLKYVLAAPALGSFQAAVGAETFGIDHGGGPGSGVRGMVNLPLGDTFAVRGSGFYQDIPGFIDDPARNATAINGVREFGGRLAAEWMPISSFKIVLQALNQTIRADDDAVVALDPVTERPVGGSLGSNLPLAQHFEQSTNLFDIALTWESAVGTLTSVLSDSSNRNRQTQDDSLEFATLTQLETGAPGFVPYTSSIDITKYTSETRLTSNPGGRIDWLVGEFATYEHGGNVQVAPELEANGTAGPISPMITAALPTIYREYAGFGDLTIHVLPQFDLSGGLRYAANNQEYEQIFGGALLTAGTEYGHSADHALLYSFSPKYILSEAVTLYARIATGYQPGGPNVGGLPGVPATVGAATLNNYEAGLKGRFLDGRLQTDVTGYRMNWHNIQTVAENSDGVGYLVNGGAARTTGVELNSSLEIVRNLVIGANFAYTDAVFVSSSPSLGVTSGQQLPLVPRYSASGTLDYTHMVVSSWTAAGGLGLRYVGARQADLFLAPAAPDIFPENSYVAVDLHGSVTHDGWRVGLYAKNLFDNRAYITKVGETDAVTGALVRIGGTVLQPRTIGLSIDRRF
jgi:iron complex outermembrane recepter protein